MVSGTSGVNPYAFLNPSSASSTATNPTGSTGLSQLDYLNLMMMQLQNQDPTKPMDDSAMMAQLSQIGVVQGVNNLNTSFGSLSASLVSNQALQASSLLGRNVMINSSSVNLPANGTLNGAVNVPSASAAVNVQIVDGAGSVVRTIPLGAQNAGITAFTWDGKNQAGIPVPAGSYAIQAQSVVNGKGQALQTLIQAPVGSVTINAAGSGNSGLTLHLNGYGDVPFASVVQIS